MAKLVYDLIGVRGRRMKLYDTKCVITTDKTVGSLISGNITDGEKTIFLKDVVGVQFKQSGVLIGYLQLETPSMQMNNQKDNMFSENTFTYEEGKNNVTNELVKQVYEYLVDRIEELKYGSVTTPTSSIGSTVSKPIVSSTTQNSTSTPKTPESGIWKCPYCETNNSTNYGQCKKCGKFRA